MWFCEIIKNLKIDGAMINFLPSWWYRNYGIAYGPDMYFNPDYRVEAYQKMKAHFYERFGKAMGMEQTAPGPLVIAPDFDNTYFQSMMGFEVRFPADQYPVAEGCLTQDQRLSLQVPDNLWQVYPFTEVASQTAYLNEKFKQNRPLLFSTRGVLNEAVQICSTEFYCDLLDEDMDEETDRVMRFICDVLKQQLLHNHTQDPSFMHTMMNCTCGIAGAPVYKQRVFAYDWEIYSFCLEHGIPVALHHCGKFDDFLDIYGQMTQLRSIDIGHESAIRPALERFPNAHIRYIISTNLLNFGSVEQIRQKAADILLQCKGHEHRFSVQVPDIEYGMPDENLFALIEALK